MATYNGHKNRNFWNVSLWIHNSEGLYHMARNFIAESPTRDAAARAMFEAFQTAGRTHTPDGAPYSVSAIRAAMRGL